MRVRESSHTIGWNELRIIGGDGLAFDPAHYGSQIILAAADFRSPSSSEKSRKKTAQKSAEKVAAPREATPQSCDVNLMSLHEFALQYINAGASILIAPTDKPAVDPVATALPADDARATMLQFRDAANDSQNKNVTLFGALGPADQLLSLNEIDETTLFDAFASHACVLKENGADAILCRSFTELESLIIAIQAAKQSTGLPIIASMTFDSGPDFTQTVLGVTIPQLCKAIAEMGVAMVGCDGGEFPDGAPAIVTMLREACKLPVYIEVSAGRAELRDDGVYYPESPEDFAERLEPLLMAGARIIGGGRGVTVEHMAEMSKIVERLEKRRRGKPA